MLIYEPTWNDTKIDGIEVTHDLKRLKRECSIILANRIEPELDDVRDKVYTRDLFSRD